MPGHVQGVGWGICDGRLGIGGGWEREEFPSVDFCVCLSGTCLFYNSGMTFFLESKYAFVLTLNPA